MIKIYPIAPIFVRIKRFFKESCEVMLYNHLKIFHILCATLLLTSIVYSIVIWRKKLKLTDIQTQTGLVILPLALLQLITGFSMISLKQENLSQLWIKASTLSFMIAILSWLSFNFLILLSTPHKTYERSQTLMLITCIFALLSMIFFMANKVT